MARGIGRAADVLVSALGVGLLLLLILVSVTVTEMLGWQVQSNAKVVAVIIALVIAGLSIGIYTAYRRLRHGRRDPYTPRHSREEAG
jgi:predicted membrane chloride channel (bestrophin family)